MSTQAALRRALRYSVGLNMMLLRACACGVSSSSESKVDGASEMKRMRAAATMDKGPMAPPRRDSSSAMAEEGDAASQEQDEAPRTPAGAALGGAVTVEQPGLAGSKDVAARATSPGNRGASPFEEEDSTASQ